MGYGLWVMGQLDSNVQSPNVDQRAYWVSSVNWCFDRKITW
jgi:hypothetical protein